MPDSQQFVKDQLIGKPDGDHLQITDVPHDWTSRAGVKGTGQFLRVEKDGKIAVVIAAEKKVFDFADFCDDDQDYIRSVLAHSGEENLVPAKKSDPPDSPVVTTQRFPTTPEMNIPGGAGSPVSPQPSFYTSNPTAPPSSGHPSSTRPTDAYIDSVNSNSGNSLTDMLNRPTGSETTTEISPPSFTGFDLPATSHSCSECGKDIKATATTCPHCHAVFDYIEDANGERTYVNGNTKASLQAEDRKFGLMLKLGVIVLVLVGSGLAKLFGFSSGSSK